LMKRQRLFFLGKPFLRSLTYLHYNICVKGSDSVCSWQAFPAWSNICGLHLSRCSTQVGCSLCLSH
jgi:hypothetical protein